mmetsp:Transcript_8637/g.23221  ORF Transcript_8637/g.23221 Transcript_8637/m.23221 type:complete len:542 (-) Transcript_8637:424-2049(-)
MTLEMHRRHLVRYICALLCVIVVASLLFNRERSQQTSAPLHLAGQDGSHGKELLLVQAVFRHGARTPLANIYFPDTKWSHCGPNEGVKLALHDENGGKSSPPPPIIDTDSPLLPGGCRQGELTKNGYVMAKDLGQWLRTRFIGELGFLSPDFKAEEVSLRTTCIARTGATLQGVLTGLWPDAAAFDAPPIPVNASREAYEIEYGKNQTCPLLGPKLALLQAKVADRDAKDPYAIAYAAKVAKRLHLTTAALSWVRLHDVLAAMIAEGLPLPDGADEKLAKEVADQAIAREGAIIAPIPEQKFLPKEECQQVIRMSIGPLLQRLIDNMRQAGHAQATSKQGGRGLLLAKQDGQGEEEARQRYRGLDDVDEVQQQQQEQQQQQQQQQGWLRRSASGLEGIHQIDGVHHGGGSSSRGGRRLARMFGQGEEGQSDKEPIRRQPKLYLFSGHDSTITPVMAALGAPLSSWPPFVSNVVLELWGSKGKGDGDNKGDDLEVRVLFDQQPLHLRGGQKGGWISLADLEAQLKPYSATMQHHKAECGIVP